MKQLLVCLALVFAGNVCYAQNGAIIQYVPIQSSIPVVTYYPVVSNMTVTNWIPVTPVPVIQQQLFYVVPQVQQYQRQCWFHRHFQYVPAYPAPSYHYNY